MIKKRFGVVRESRGLRWRLRRRTREAVRRCWTLVPSPPSAAAVKMSTVRIVRLRASPSPLGQSLLPGKQALVEYISIAYNKEEIWCCERKSRFAKITSKDERGGAPVLDIDSKSTVGGGVEDVYGEDLATEDQSVTPWTISVASGYSLLRDPHYNKGLVFTEKERDAHYLLGFLPLVVKKMMHNIHQHQVPLQKYMAMMDLQERNERLFYKILIDNVEELLPIVYTPTVGEACQKYGSIFRHPQQKGLRETTTKAPLEEMHKKIWLVDSKGLIVSSCKNSLLHFKKPWAPEHEPVKDLLEAVKAIKPTVLIGSSGVERTFTKEVIEAMASFNEKPLIMALSNPTSQSECTVEEAYTWSQGHAIFDSGSPFDPVEYNVKLSLPGQANNAYIFPGFGLRLVISSAIHVHDEMLLAASEALAEQVTKENLDKGLIYPSFSNIEKISGHIAANMAAKAYELGLAMHLPRRDNLVKYAESCTYTPNYRSFR
ncbi:NADP-dependent malic enzyme-like [Camellia sinensis]|uniref:NADP-dependent malic enzyme-like n=1 Tax=Camellia sinensis TaxID=4442 RepID=UPI001035C118|nr:NADP-dependent malic enzyme-like [Camellia sinensis]